MKHQYVVPTVEDLKPKDMNGPITHSKSDTPIQVISDHSVRPDCYLTDERYFCDSKNCQWATRCKKLTAEWLR